MENKINVFILVVNAIIIHLRLKMEENAIISIVFFLFIWEIDPTIDEIKMNGMIVFFWWNIIKYAGAIFCHVIRIVLFLIFDFLMIFTNHWWNGDEAIFTIKMMILIFMIFVVLVSFVFSSIIIRTADEIDWIIRYFILVSTIFLFSFLMEVFIIEQNERVFISRAIQIQIHEFLMKHKIDEMKIVVIIIIVVLISLENQIANLGLLRDILNLPKQFTFWRRIVFNLRFK